MKKLLVAILGSTCWAMPVMAADMTEIGPGETGTINAHEICRKITNNNAIPVMVPHKTAEEWSVGPNSFLAEDRPGIKVETCSNKIWTNTTCAEWPNGWQSWVCPFSNDPSIFSYSEETGDCSRVGEGKVIRIEAINPPAYFYEAVYCIEKIPEMQEHFFLGIAHTNKIEEYVSAPLVKATVPSQVSVQGHARFRVNNGSWIYNTYNGSFGSVFVEKGDVIEFQVKSGGINLQRWATLGLGGIRRKFWVYTD